MPQNRLLTIADIPSLEAFEVPTHRRSPWTELADDAFRLLPSALRLGGTTAALGRWDDAARLVSVLAYAVDPDEPSTWYSNVLVTAVGCVRRGHARALKQHLIEIARDAGATRIVSAVHRDNDPMLELNAEFGATITADPESFASPYLICEIEVR